MKDPSLPLRSYGHPYSPQDASWCLSSSTIFLLPITWILKSRLLRFGNLSPRNSLINYFTIKWPSSLAWLEGMVCSTNETSSYTFHVWANASTIIFNHTKLLLMKGLLCLKDLWNKAEFWIPFLAKQRDFSYTVVFKVKSWTPHLYLHTYPLYLFDNWSWKKKKTVIQSSFFDLNKSCLCCESTSKSNMVLL